MNLPLTLGEVKKLQKKYPNIKIPIVKIGILGNGLRGDSKITLTAQYVQEIFVEKYAIEDTYRKQIEIDGVKVIRAFCSTLIL
jgi:hypothetical protein